MKLIYPNKTAVESKKTFIYKVNGKDYLFYTTGEPANGLETVCFGELKDGSLFAVAAEEMEHFKLFLTDFANDRVKDNTKYTLEPDRDIEVTVYGGAKSQITTDIINAITAPTTVAPVAEATPVAPVAPVAETTPTEPVKETVVKETTNTVKEVAADAQPAKETPAEPTAPVTTATSETPVKEEKPKKKSNPLIVVILIIILLGMGAYAYYEYVYKANSNNNSTSSTTTTSVTVSESTSVAVTNMNLICTKNDSTKKEQVVDSNIDITYNSTTGDPVAIVETTMNTFTSADALKTYTTAQDAIDRSADTALGITYTHYSNEKTFAYTLMKSTIKSAVGETTWTDATTNYKTLTAAKNYLTSMGYTCTESD